HLGSLLHFGQPHQISKHSVQLSGGGVQLSRGKGHTVVVAVVKLDPKANQVRGELKVISAKGSKIPVVVIPTNEELMIARDTVKVLGA
ncbi:MAG: hypothetical protein IJ983_00320, partial [Kiritimatiellae bacterium]|nr:hypothetical protein [Kiritimatiellia bacterium]